MKEIAQKIGKVVAAVLVRVGEAFKREPTLVRLALMGVLGSLAIWTPEQLAGFEALIDKLTPAILLLMGAELRSKVTPANAPRTTVTVPVELPKVLPSGPSGAF
jgi:predicted Na+-dependent transporter